MKKGDIIDVTESLGMTILKGEFIGFLKQNGIRKFLVFKKVGDSIFGDCSKLKPERFFAAKWSIYDYDVTSPFLYLISTHYGDSPESLKECGYYLEKKPVFEEA